MSRLCKLYEYISFRERQNWQISVDVPQNEFTSAPQPFVTETHSLPCWKRLREKSRVIKRQCIWGVVFRSAVETFSLANWSSSEGRVGAFDTPLRKGLPLCNCGSGVKLNRPKKHSIVKFVCKGSMPRRHAQVRHCSYDDYFGCYVVSRIVANEMFPRGIFTYKKQVIKATPSIESASQLQNMTRLNFLNTKLVCVPCLYQFSSDHLLWWEYTIGQQSTVICPGAGMGSIANLRPRIVNQAPFIATNDSEMPQWFLITFYFEFLKQKWKPNVLIVSYRFIT